MADISYEDMVNLYQGTVVLYKEEPAYVKRIAENKDINLYLIVSQKTVVCKNIEDIKPPSKRIGYVNVDKTVFYLERLPVRKYQVGISTSNLKINPILDLNENARDSYATIAKLQHKGLGEAMLGIYPSLKSAKEFLSKNAGFVAFDHQFCINEKHEVYYKNTKVGQCARAVTNPAKITLNKEFSHLSKLLGGSYETVLIP